MTDHQQILRHVFQHLDAHQRFLFLAEIFESLPAEDRETLLQLLNEAPGEETVQSIMTRVSNAPNNWVTDLPKQTLPHTQEKGSSSPNKMITPEKPTVTSPQDAINSAITAFEMQHQTELAGQKKILRKEVFSCLGLGLLGVAILIGLSVGLKYLWTVLFS